MPLDYDKLKEKKNKRFGKGWTPDPGDNVIRVLAPTSKYFDELIGFIGYEFRSHFIGLEGQDLQVVRCLRDFNESCPACTFYYGNRNNDDPGVAEIAQEFNPSTRFVLNILDIQDPSSGIQTYECGPSVHNEILKYAANEDWGDVLDPETGRNFTVTLTLAKFNDYDVTPSPNPESILHHLPSDWKEQIDALQHDVPERPSKGVMENLIKAARVLAFDEEPPQPEQPSNEPVNEQYEPEQTQSGFSASGSPPSSPSQDEEVEGNLAPRVDGGPDINPETGQPVCFGKYNTDKYPCDNCDVEEDCQMVKVGLA